MYKVTTILGGGIYWYYLLNPNQKIIMAINCLEQKQLDYIHNVKNLLNLSLVNG